MERNVIDHSMIRVEIKQIIDKYQKLRSCQNAKGDFVIQGLLEFSTIEKGYFIEDALSVKILIPVNYPKEPVRVWELDNRIPKHFHTNPDSSLCLGTRIDIESALSDDDSLFEFVEQILIRYLFSFCVWEKTGKFPFGERQHGAKGIIESYQGYFSVPDIESAKRLLHYLSRMKRFSRKKWCPCRSHRRIQHCHGNIMKHLLKISTKERFIEDYNTCKLL